MIKSLSIILIAVMLIPAFIIAQEQTYMRPDGKFYRSSKVPTSYEVMKVKHAPKKTVNSNILPSGPLAGVNGVLDTLSYTMVAPLSNFGLNGQDILIQWFKAPADLTIKGFAYYSEENLNNSVITEGKIVSVNLTEAQLMAGTVHWDGYYEATGNGYNDITAYLDNADRTGAWTSMSGDPEPFGNDIWSDGGFGAPSLPAPLTDYQWINTDILFEPTVLGGEIFGITFNSTYTDMTVRSLGFLASQLNPVIPGWKYYSNGRLDIPNDKGWWVREYTWDFLVAVDITGDIPPDFNSFTNYTGTMSTSARTVDANVTDANPGGTPGVASVTLMVTTDGGTNYTSIPMTGTEPNYTADIPGYPAGTTVDYYLEATDNNAHTSISDTKSYYVFAPTAGVKTLVVFSGKYMSAPDATGEPYDSYFGPDLVPSGIASFDHDVWAYGTLEQEVANNYDNIIEIANYGTAFYQRNVIRTWLVANSSRNYFLAGQEWLGTDNAYSDSTYVPGDFEYDILGVAHSYNDVSYDGTVGQALGSLLFPQTGSRFGNPLIAEFNLNPTDSMVYDPNIYLPGTPDPNWNDGFDALSDVEIDLKLETRGEQNSAGTTVPFVDTLNCGGHRVLTAGNKIAFFSLDPLAIGGSPDSIWYGFSNNGIGYQVLNWFGIDIVLDVESVGNTIPEEFSISQNYPNPFNPSTTIDFALPKASKVVLKIYDILGREVATLLNGEKAAGNYKVDFDASKLASGVYMYTINAGSFTSTKKMMLMK